MSTHYQVIADFGFSNRKPLLLNLSLHSTTAARTLWPVQPPGAKSTTHYHIFKTKEMAHAYIAHLFKVYPNSPAAYPVLDKGQSDLFQEVSQCV